MKALLFAEYSEKGLLPATLKALHAVSQWVDVIDLALLGSKEQLTPFSDSIPAYSKVCSVKIVTETSLSDHLPEYAAPALASMAAGYDLVCGANSTTGKNLLPRLAALMDVPMFSNTVSYRKEDKTVSFLTRAGNALKTVRSLANICVLSIQTSRFQQAHPEETSLPCEQMAWAPEKNYPLTSLSIQAETHSRPSLSSAACVVSGGRGLKSKEHFQMIETLADTLNAAVGASRAAVDAGFIANEHQVGQTGQTIAPQLYLSFGISGAIQHWAGIKDSKVIVAINQDEEAPLMKGADYSLKADVFDVLPQLITHFSKK